MDYIRQSLTDDEELVHVAHFHWLYTLQAVFNIVFGLILAVVIIVAATKIEPMIFKHGGFEGLGPIDTVRALHPGVKILAFFVFVMGLFRYAHMMIIKATTEIAVTNKRLVYKRGLVARYVGEINVDRIEGVNVLQGVFGRIFNYGRIMVRGMGIGEIVLPSIDDPLKFRKAIEKARNV
jgi:Bacterial PH domain